uniref:Uncharacterized protein n=1 Tax=Anguilla anguilla TaxID=7936 RepID=A0A0E9QCW1_ANGAN
MRRAFVQFNGSVILITL